MIKASRELELLVAKIQSQLAPNAEVLQDVLLEGRVTKRKRQIDVLVRDRVGQYDIQIIVECKDYKKRVDVKGVEEFYGLLTDVGAQKGVLVCPKGFTETAKTRAEGFQIDLYSPVDTNLHKWRVRATMPALCDFRKVMMSFQLAVSSPFPFSLPKEFYRNRIVFDENGADLGTIINVATKKWRDGVFPRDAGEYKDVKIFDTNSTHMDNGYGMKAPVDLSVSLFVERDLYFGQFPILKISGFKDEMSGGVITNAFEVGLLSPEEVERDWLKIASENDAPIKPVMTITGNVVWDDYGEQI
jgi:hypothetical protein